METFSTLNKLVEDLLKVAAVFDGAENTYAAADRAGVEYLPYVGLKGEITYRANWQTTRMTLRIPAAAYDIRARAEKLKRDYALVKRETMPVNLKSRVSLRRPGYSENLFKGFIKAGEIENAHAYKDLYAN